MDTPGVKRTVRPNRKTFSQLISGSSTPNKRAVSKVPPAPIQRTMIEGEDAKMTGMTRSLSRRVMALNFPVSAVVPSGRVTIQNQQEVA